MSLLRIGQGAALFLCLLSAAHSTVVLPNTNGTYNVTISTMKLVDQSRFDPFAPISEPRAVMISLYHPTICSQRSSTSLVNYMPPKTAAFVNDQFAAFGIPNNTFSQLKIAQCSPNISNRHSKSEPLPVLLFSPALGTTRLFYSAMVMAVASTGYTVVSIDHPYDTDILEFPDGTTIFAGNSSTDAFILLDLETRAADASFVLNQLSRTSIAQKLVPSMSHGFDVRKVGMFGHSLGGAAVATTMLNDSRIAGGMNLDGSLFGSVLSAGLDHPFILFGHSGKNISNDPSWATMLANLRGFKSELGLEGGSQHYTFSDMPLLVKKLGFWDVLPDVVFERIGRLDGERAVEVVKNYVTAFFDILLKGDKKGVLYKGPNEAFPEVTFLA
jgi:hypothetical protein